MSVINSMLRDLDRRHAPLPIQANVLPTLAKNNRALPRSAVALCSLIILVVWSWNHHSTKIIAAPAVQSPLPAGEGKGEGTPRTETSATLISLPREIEKKSLNQIVTQTETPKTISEKTHEKTALTPTPLPRGEESKPAENKFSAVIEQPAPIIKQDRTNPNAINDERYQLARTALAEHQPQRAYELLRDNPPALSTATDYHAVLAAVEQQLGYYADASLRYQQLLQLDQNQASWWLGFALSLEGEHRNREALAAYQRAETLNSLPDAARQYVASRIAALGPITGKVEAGQ